MKISEMVNYLTDILVKQGDLELYQASDYEGNNYFKVIQKPEVLYLLAENKGQNDIDYLYDSLDEIEHEIGDGFDADKVLLI